MLPVHHQGKNDDTSLYGMRGSSSLPGWLDVRLRFSRPSEGGDPRSPYRQITTEGRDGLNLRPVVFGVLSPDGKTYLAVSREEATAGGLLSHIANHLKAHPERDFVPAELLKEIPWPKGQPPSLGTLGNVLREGYDKKLWDRPGGNGQRGDPFRYRTPLIARTTVGQAPPQSPEAPSPSSSLERGGDA